jgi:hypothetical protein
VDAVRVHAIAALNLMQQPKHIDFSRLVIPGSAAGDRKAEQAVRLLKLLLKSTTG